MAKKTTKKGAAHKQGKTTKGKAPVPKGISIAEFREAAREYLRADENEKLHKKAKAAVYPVVKEYVEKHAVHLDKGKSDGLVDNGIKWLLVPGALRFDEDQGVAAIQDAIAKAKGDKRRILEACLVTKVTIDKDAWADAKAVGMIDKSLQDVCEKGQSLSLKWSHTDQLACSNCGAVVNRTAKFCSGCGESLGGK